MILKPKNWGAFQHYKDRCPPWIKLHRDMLNDRAFAALPIASKALAPLLWLLASESKGNGGEFDASDEELTFRLRFSLKDIQIGRKSLIDKGFFIHASNTPADASNMHTDAIPEKRREEEETEKQKMYFFEIFWKAYPKKVGKDAAMRAFQKRKVDSDLLQVMLDAIEKQSKQSSWLKDDGQYIPNPATWLNGERWKDQLAIPEKQTQQTWI